MKIFTLCQKLKNNKRGVMLVDSIVAVVVVSLGLVAVIQLYTRGTQYRYMASMRQKAVQIAAERIEKLKTQNADTKISDPSEVNTDDENITLGDSGEVFTSKLEVVKPTSGVLQTDKLLLVRSKVEYKLDIGPETNNVVKIETYI